MQLTLLLNMTTLVRSKSLLFMFRSPHLGRLQPRAYKPRGFPTQVSGAVVLLVIMSWLCPDHPRLDLSRAVPTMSATHSLPPLRPTTSATSARDSEDPKPTRSPSPPSPVRPPVSPITPELKPAQLAPAQQQAPAPAEPQKPSHVRPTPLPPAIFQKQPQPVPISESDNPDAIALRSAMSLLQLQREKSKRDIKALEQLREAAVRDPEGFARHIQAQAQARRQPSRAASNDPLGPTLSPSTPSDETVGGAKPEEDEDEEDDRPFAAFDVNGSDNGMSKLPAIPQPQNIIRCPPINWAKYHIVGEPLDKMHEEQRKWPGASEPPRTYQGHRAPPHAVASPYSPFLDGVANPFTPPGQKGLKRSPI